MSTHATPLVHAHLHIAHLGHTCSDDVTHQWPINQCVHSNQVKVSCLSLEALHSWVLNGRPTAGMQPHASMPQNFHLTVFMTSQPGDPRPDIFTPGGGIDPTHPPVPIPAPEPSALQKEIDTCRQIALTTAPAFEVQCCEQPTPSLASWMLHAVAMPVTDSPQSSAGQR